MMMKKIIYYITDHGMGHSTRSIAIIRELKKNNVEVIVRNSNNKLMLEKSLPDIQVVDGLTDIGPIIKNDGISLDPKKSKDKIESWIKNMPKIAKNEINFISDVKPSLIISDVSAMPILAAHYSKIPSLIISNFTWVDVCDFISLDYQNLLKKYYSFSDYVIKLPLGTKMNHFKKVKSCNLVSRKPTISKTVIKNTLKLNKKFSILFTLGKSENSIFLDSELDCDVISTGSQIIFGEKIIKPISWIEGQDLINSVDLVICKCGYSTISECLSTGTPFYYIFDDFHLEQNAISTQLNLQGFDLRIPNNNRFSFNLDFFNSINSFEPIKTDNDSVVNYILSILN